MSGISLTQAVTQGGLRTPIPTGNRPAAGRQVEKANYSGKHHAQCLSVQVAANTDATLVQSSDPVPCSRHDNAALRLCGWDQVLAGADWIADTAYTAHGALTLIKKSSRTRRLPWEKSSTGPYHPRAPSSSAPSPHRRNGRSCQPATATA